MDPNMKLLIVTEVTRKFERCGTLWRKNTLFFTPKFTLMRHLLNLLTCTRA